MKYIDLTATTAPVAPAEDKTDKPQKWRGLRYDEETGKWEVYVTQRISKIFDDVESALSYMKSA